MCGFDVLVFWFWFFGFRGKALRQLSKSEGKNKEQKVCLRYSTL